MNSDKQYESALHQALRLGDEELRSELRGKGLNPEGEANALRSMIFIALAKIPRALCQYDLSTDQPKEAQMDARLSANHSVHRVIDMFDKPASLS